MLVSYLRDEKRVPIGCFVSNGRNKIGFSICNKEDHFVKSVGRGLAEMRIVDANEAIDIIVDKLEDYEGKYPSITPEVLLKCHLFKRRINKYFKEE